MATGLEEGLRWLRDRSNQIDCLILESSLLTADLEQMLSTTGILLPVVLLVVDEASAKAGVDPGDFIDHLSRAYHGAVVPLPRARMFDLERAVQQAIQEFLALPADRCTLPPSSLPDQIPIPDLLSAQQERLTDKLKARLGYLGVYYKRNAEHFLRNMSQADRDAFLRQLKADYRKIILGYFANDPKLNQNIDAFVNQTFMADISVSHIVEIHMELMDEFSKQLKLEGRSEEILLDYRLTLIDVIAHLCEMYRRSIPREP
ncbi:MAG TPA: circadian clock protein KaiA [Leptolyngbyaceae cyanobacterium M65_K2018_010]|nr:circadian clock protein KaiA [Leptolyngbyaceae cyanobacterium M65_K2018_010]